MKIPITLIALSLTTGAAQTLHAFRNDHGVTLNFTHTNAGQFTLYAGTNALLIAPTNNWYRSVSIVMPTDKAMALYTVRSPDAPIVRQEKVYELKAPEVYGPWPNSPPALPGGWK